MTEVRPAANADAARWLLRSDVDWWDLVRYGPPGFDVYVRIAFGHEAEGVDPAGEEPALRTTLVTLATYTASPSRAFAAIWEGWTGGGPAPEAPRVEIPHRAMLLFTGPVEVLRDAPSIAWYGSVQEYQEPHLVWPEDQAWCLACEVDEEIEFTVGCSVDASQALARALPGAVRQVRYGEPAPLYRDPASSRNANHGSMDATYPGGHDVDPFAVPGVYRGTESEPGVPSFTLEVDGELFAFRPDEQGGTDYTWLSAPNKGYGFSLSRHRISRWRRTGRASAPSLLRLTPPRATSRTTEAKDSLPSPG